MQKHTFRAFNCSESEQKTHVADENEPVRVIQHLISCPHLTLTPLPEKEVEEWMLREIEKLAEEVSKQIERMVYESDPSGIVAWRLREQEGFEVVCVDR